MTLAHAFGNTDVVILLILGGLVFLGWAFDKAYKNVTGWEDPVWKERMRQQALSEKYRRDYEEEMRRSREESEKRIRRLDDITRARKWRQQDEMMNRKFPADMRPPIPDYEAEMREWWAKQDEFERQLPGRQEEGS